MFRTRSDNLLTEKMGTKIEEMAIGKREKCRSIVGEHSTCSLAANASPQPSSSW
jgi:hypothetical protein